MVGTRGIGLVLCVAVILAGCASEIRSNLVIVRPMPGCPPGASCVPEQVTAERAGSCMEQQPQPGEQIVSCTDEKHTHLTSSGKTWITVGAVGAGVLVTAYIVVVVLFIGAFA